MAFILPSVFLGFTGFALGYVFNNKNSENIDKDLVYITEKDLMKLKEQSPHREINIELINFDKSKLKKTKQYKSAYTNDILHELKKKIDPLRTVIKMDSSVEDLDFSE